MLPTLLVHLVALLAPAADRPAYVVETAPTKTIEAVFTYEVEAPKLIARDWVLFAARAPELPCQTDVKSTIEPNGKEADELSELRRPILLAHVPAGKEHETGLTVHVRYEASLLARHLVPLKPGVEFADVPPLKGAARTEALRPSKNVDFEAKAFQQWLDTSSLRRRPDESEVDFGRRAFLYIKKHYGYEYTGDMKRDASTVCNAKATDCGGMAVLFVATLRANKVPARLLAGRWADSAKKGDKIGEVAYFQQHVKAEFHADGIGWVPVDLSSAVLYDKSKEGLRHFGNDPGNFLVLHVDPDLLLDTLHFGKKEVNWLQGVNYWVSGEGSLEKSTNTEDWQVKVKSKK